MSNPANSYVSQINRLNKEIQRLNKRIRDLRAERRRHESHLLSYLESTGGERAGNFTVKSLRTRLGKGPTRTRKKETEKRRDAIALFREVGVPNPETFYKEFKDTQRGVLQE